MATSKSTRRENTTKMIEIGRNVTISYDGYFACHGRKQEHNKIIICDGALVNKSVPNHSYVIGVPIRILEKTVNRNL